MLMGTFCTVPYNKGILISNFELHPGWNKTFTLSKRQKVFTNIISQDKGYNLDFDIKRVYGEGHAEEVYRITLSPMSTLTFFLTLEPGTYSADFAPLEAEGVARIYL